jgi:hypothetical protein
MKVRSERMPEALNAHADGLQAHAKKSSLNREPFLGIWADRADMKDSAAWVRENREREWGR